MQLDRLVKKALENCREGILGDEKLKTIDSVFYDLLDGVDSEIVAKLEDAYLEYGSRAMELAYIQGLKDAQKTD